jgi:hypothetical protein
VLGLLAAQAAVTLFPATRRLLGIAALGALDLTVIATGSLAPFLAVELIKAGAGEQSARPPMGKPRNTSGGQRMIEAAQFDGPVAANGVRVP